MEAVGTPRDEATMRAMESQAFYDYYRAQLMPDLIADDDEWDRFEACLRSPLPVTFRFSGSSVAAGCALRRKMEEDHLPSIAAATPHPLPWYPDRLAWQLHISRMQLRGKEKLGAETDAAERSASVKAFHVWLLRETELGHVQRQESVSMVPALMLDVQASQRVLDMCASPGSKTQQARAAATRHHSRALLYCTVPCLPR